MWKSSGLDEVCNVEYGTRVVRKKDQGTLYPVYGGGGKTFSVDQMNRNDRVVISRFAMSEKCTRMVKGEFFLNDSGLTISAKDRKILRQDFLDWLVLGLNDSIYSLGRGTAQRNLDVDAFRKIIISFPLIPEQQRIVAILDQAFADIEKARANAEKNLKNARELFDSYLNQVFSQRGEGWVETLLGDVCGFKHGFAFKSEHFTQESNLVLLTPGNFFEEGGYRDRGSKQKYYKGPFPREFLLPKGCLLVAMTEQAAGLLGSSLVVPEENTFLHNQRLGLVQLAEAWKERVSLEFLSQLFNAQYFRAKVQETGSGLKVRHTSPKKLQAITVWIPKAKDEQCKIVNDIARLKKETIRLEVVCQNKLNSLDELKKSLLQKAFSGELTKTEGHAA